MIKKRLGILILISALSISLVGCTKKPASTSGTFFPEELPLVTSTSNTTETSVSTGTEVSVSFEDNTGEKAETVDFKLLVVNECNADIGMVSIIDPVGHEQMDLGSLANGSLLSMDFTSWPLEETKLAIAFYSKAGKLVSSSEVDLNGVTKQVSVFLSGDGNIEKIKCEVK